ncbi:MAG TPA: twin-arginine translocase TatA/TatE family subunit [Ferrovibrio sp.]|jgi:sec-independent protein translocase protein TatA|uniref:twin-arginine translocase TatA/TatE family subunit n=1 Tax=Ferrovibrio sp. TaxID=1917215 RepID=UPI002B4B2718|nr:twin-arginine translocase TatA/TatE family subunit [Ferrovibrio sp.]HLT77233.1 twin-arginine translocase TatA/TatE family subunit [Ferrovibrio sp.]
MGTFSFWHWLIVLLVILIIFGAGKLPRVAGDLASGIKNFRKGMKEDTDEKPANPPVIDQQQTPTGGAASTSAPADKAQSH